MGMQAAKDKQGKQGTKGILDHSSVSNSFKDFTAVYFKWV